MSGRSAAYIFAVVADVVALRCRSCLPHALSHRNEVMVVRVHDLGQLLQDRKLAAHKIGEGLVLGERSVWELL